MTDVQIQSETINPDVLDEKLSQWLFIVKIRQAKNSVLPFDFEKGATILAKTKDASKLDLKRVIQAQPVLGRSLDPLFSQLNERVEKALDQLKHLAPAPQPTTTTTQTIEEHPSPQTPVETPEQSPIASPTSSPVASRKQEIPPIAQESPKPSNKKESVIRSTTTKKSQVSSVLPELPDKHPFEPFRSIEQPEQIINDGSFKKSTNISYRRPPSSNRQQRSNASSISDVQLSKISINFGDE